MKFNNPQKERNSFVFLGDNPTKGKANDTVAFWASQGPGFAWFYETSMLNGDPPQYGYLLNFCNEGNSDIHQLYLSQRFGSVCHRSCNGADVAMPSTWTALTFNENWYAQFANGMDWALPATKAHAWGLKNNCVLTSSWAAPGGNTSTLFYIRK